MVERKKKAKIFYWKMNAMWFEYRWFTKPSKWKWWSSWCILGVVFGWFCFVFRFFGYFFVPLMVTTGLFCLVVLAEKNNDLPDFLYKFFFAGGYSSDDTSVIWIDLFFLTFSDCFFFVCVQYRWSILLLLLQFFFIQTNQPTKQTNKQQHLYDARILFFLSDERKNDDSLRWMDCDERTNDDDDHHKRSVIIVQHHHQHHFTIVAKD